MDEFIFAGRRMMQGCSEGNGLSDDFVMIVKFKNRLGNNCTGKKTWTNLKKMYLQSSF